VSGGAWWRSAGKRCPGRRRGSALATGRACRGLVRISGCGQQGERRAVLGSDRPASGARSKARQRTGSQSGLPWPGQGVGLLAVVLSYRQFVRVFVLSIGEACREATTAPVSGGAWWRSAGKRCPGRRRGSALATGRACCGLVRVSGCWPWCSVTGSSSGSSFSRLMKPAERRRRRQRRAVLGDDRRQAVPGRRRGSALAASRACRGLVRVSGCGQQGERRAVLGGDRRQAVPGRRRGSALAASRACCGLVRVSGCWPWCSVTGSSSGSSFSRLMKPAERRRRRQRRAVLGDDRRQAVPGRRRGSALAASRACCGLVRVSGCWPWCSVTGSSSGSSFSRLMKPAERRRRRQRRAVLGDDRRQAVPGRRRGSALAASRACRGLVRVSGCGPWCSVTGSSSGSSFSRLVKPAERRRRRQCRAVLGGDRPASGARSNARRRTGGRSGLLWSAGQGVGLRSARRASGGAWWRSPASGARSKARQRTGGRSGLPWPGQGVGLLAVVLSHRQFVRVFVLSIGEACREATTAPVSGGAWWRSAGKRCQAEDETTHWQPIGLAVAWSGSRVAGSKASVGQCLVAIAGKRCQAEDEAAHWRPIGLAVAWSGPRVAGRGAQLPAVRPGLRSLDW
jgi:hypothetical protein